MPVTPARATARRVRRTARADDSVLISKITVPALPKWNVSRERVQALIANGSRGPLTVVTGPPGSGKTMALASWAAAESRSGPLAWVTVDRYDNRPEVFWSHVIEALRRAGVALPAELPTAVSRQPSLFLHHFASALAAQDPVVVTLILDDVHLLTKPRCLDGLDYVLRNASGGLHLLVASRMDPLLPLHRYRLTGELTEVRACDLAFSVTEAGLLMAQHGITLPPGLLETVTRRGEGWAAGLRLAAISMDGHPDPGQFVKELEAEDGPIAGYLIDEVLNHQPAQVRDLLLRTSILDRVNVELAGELAAARETGEIIPALAQANAFVQPIGHGWYRYHSLFADVLRLKFRHESPHKVTQLRRRAARWLWRNGTLLEAVGQAAAAGDWALAARIAVEELAVGTLLDPRAGGPLAEAFRPMPASPAPQEPPQLIVAAALALRRAPSDAGATRLAGAERLLERLPDGEELPSRMAVALIRMALARHDGDLPAAAEASARAGRLLAQMPPDLLSRHPEVRMQELSARGGVQMWSGRLDDAASTLDQAAAVMCGSCDCFGLLAMVEALRGRFTHASKLAATAGARPGAGSAWHHGAAAEVALAWAHLERNQLSEAAGRLARAEDALHAQPDRLIGAVAWLVAARLSLARGRAEAAAEMIARAGGGWPLPPWLQQRMALAASHAHAAAGDVQAALEAARRAGPPSSLTGAVALARARLAAADPRAAAQTLAGASVTVADQAPDLLSLEAGLLEAELGYGGGDPDRGRPALEHALKLAEKERMLLPFAIERAWIEPVLRRDAGLAEDFRRLFQPPAAPGRALAPPSAAGQPAPVIVEQLSGRELEVLRHVSRMLSTAEIAEEMYLSVNTVKSHLKSIFRKLGVGHRREAVRRARQLALL
jgi:LuxR family transcriptional regulator, maltose regulon positive regulatory protein